MAIWSGNADSLAAFYPLHFLAWTGVFLAFGYMVAIGISLVVRDPARWARSYTVAALSILIFQAWDRLTIAVTDVAEALGSGLAWSIVGVIGLLVTLLAIRLAPSFPAVRPIIGVVAAFLVGAHLLSAAWFGVEQLVSATPLEHVQASTDAQGTGPDVLVVVLDGYGRHDVLSERFGFDNTDFEADLASIGIRVIPRAKATYTMTALSVGGLLSGEYPATETRSASVRDLHAIHSGDNRLFGAMRLSGYEVHMFDNAWTFTECSTNVDYCYSGGMNELDAAVAARTPLPSLVPRLRVNPWVRGSVSQIREATVLASVDSTRPRLIYLHALIPHPPFQLTAECNIATGPAVGSMKSVADSQLSRVSYASQLQCTNSLILDLVSSMSDDAIILVTGDHGPRWAGQDPIKNPSATDSEVLTRIGIFTAYRFPDHCDPIPADAALMTSTLHLFDCLRIEHSLTTEESVQFYSQVFEGGQFFVTDITERVTRLD